MGCWYSWCGAKCTGLPTATDVEAAKSQLREEWWRPPQWLLRLLLCNCIGSGMWLGRMCRIFHHLKGGSNQPQSLASSTWPFESQCFISEHKLLDRVSLLPKVVFRGTSDHGKEVKQAPVFTYRMHIKWISVCPHWRRLRLLQSWTFGESWQISIKFRQKVSLDLIKALLLKFRINARHLGFFFFFIHRSW